MGSGEIEGPKGLSLTWEKCSHCMLQTRQGESRKYIFQPLCFLPPCSHLHLLLVTLWQNVSPVDVDQSKAKAGKGERGNVKAISTHIELMV